MGNTSGEGPKLVSQSLVLSQLGFSWLLPLCVVGLFPVCTGVVSSELCPPTC
ncbi:hypothetical protein BDW59DRAFT_155523 [Aspergillus cavernicola]|uniref:Uncharacterized protein n=1 Tax=Aspergillus cavernicola TaxID=176166 RepID=A0ABR4H7Y0_9EURO